MPEGENVIRIPGRTEDDFKIERELQPGQTAEVVYLGRPFTLVIGGNKGHRRLTIGKVDDLKLRYQFEPDVDFLIFGGRVLFDISGGTREFKGLRDGEQVVLGDKYPGRFDLKNLGIADRAVRINREGQVISVTRLEENSSKVVVIVGKPYTSRHL